MLHKPRGELGMAGKPFRATYIWSSIIANLQQRVEVKRRRHNLKTYHDCFLGSEAVDVVLAHVIQSRFCSDAEVPRAKAVRLCQALMDSRVFEAVGTKVFRNKEKRRATFEDSSCSLYRFLPASSSPTNVSSVHSTSNITIESGYNSQSEHHNSYSPPLARQDEQYSNNNSPVKSDKSLEDVLGNLNFTSTITQQMINLGLSQELVDEVWRQQTVFRLLQLIELPLLESLLEGGERPRHRLHGMDSDPDLLLTSSYLDREVLKAFSEAQLEVPGNMARLPLSHLMAYIIISWPTSSSHGLHSVGADEWLATAVDCLELLPDELVVEVSRGLPRCGDDQDQCKRLLYRTLAQHYGETQHPPLLSNHVFDIQAGISELLVNGKTEQALEALQLCLKLQDSQSKEELRRLLRFMSVAAKPGEVKLHKEIENRMAVKRAFSGAIVYSTRLAKGKVNLLVLFMVEKHGDVFKIPASVHQLVSDRLTDIVKGNDPEVLTGSAYCKRISGKAYEENRQNTTKDELWSLLKKIHKNPKLSNKEKTRLLGQFYKGHPDIFVQYFGSSFGSDDMLC